MTKTQIVLPARLASTRLPKKLLQRVAGKSVLQHTFKAAARAACARDGIVIAVDDQRVAREVESFGGRWIMTPKECASGTDRIAYVAARFPDVEVFVNVQSDEPEIAAEAIDAVANALHTDPTAEIATAGTPILNSERLLDPSVVKIVMADFVPQSDSENSHSAERSGQSPGQAHPTAGQAHQITGQGRAVYFSRSPVPHLRDQSPEQYFQSLSERPIEPNHHGGNATIYWHHLGLYAYRRDFLDWFASAPPSPLEQIEKLEQLRAIEAGKKIVVAAVGPAAPGIDTPEDLDAFRERLEQDTPGPQ